MLNSQPGPTLLGFDVILVGTILAGVAAFAVFMAIYAAVTVKDPMAKRVKSLNDRREELKAGIVTATAKKRASLVRKTDTTDAMKEKLEGMKASLLAIKAPRFSSLTKRVNAPRKSKKAFPMRSICW